MFKNKNAVFQALSVQALSISVLCSPMLHAMEAALTTQQALPHTTLCPRSFSACSFYSNAAVQKRYSMVHPNPTHPLESATTAPGVCAEKTAELIALRNILATQPFRSLPYSVEVPDFVQLDGTQVTELMEHFGYNVQDRWHGILDATEIGNNTLSERFISASEQIATEIDQFAKLVSFYELLELKKNEFDAPYWWNNNRITVLEFLLTVDPSILCTDGGQSPYTSGTVSALQDRMQVRWYTEYKMFSIGSCLAHLGGKPEAETFGKIRDFLRGTLSFFDTSIAQFLSQAQNAQALITVRLANGAAQNATAGNAYSMEELQAPTRSATMGKVIQLYADQFRRAALMSRFAAGHVFDLPRADFLLQEAPSVQSNGELAIECRVNSTTGVGRDTDWWLSSARCGQGATAQEESTDSYFTDIAQVTPLVVSNVDLTVSRIQVKQVSTLEETSNGYHLKPTSTFTIDSTLTREEQLAVRKLVFELMKAYSSPDSIQPLSVVLTFNRAKNRISLIEVRPLIPQTTRIESISIDTDPAHENALTRIGGIDFYRTITLMQGRDREVLTFQNLTQIIKQFSEIDPQDPVAMSNAKSAAWNCLAVIILKLKTIIEDTTKTAHALEGTVNKLIPRNFFERFIELFESSKPALLQSELDQLKAIYINAVSMAMSIQQASRSYVTPVTSRTNCRPLEPLIRAEMVEALLFQQPAPGVVNSFSFESVMAQLSQKMAFLQNHIKPLLEAGKISTTLVRNRSYFDRAFKGVNATQTAEQTAQWIIFVDTIAQMNSEEQAAFIAPLKNSSYDALYENWKKSI